MSTTTENPRSTLHDRAAWDNLTTLGISANQRSGRRPAAAADGRAARSPEAWQQGVTGGTWRTFQSRARGVVARVKRRIVTGPLVSFDES